MVEVALSVEEEVVAWEAEAGGAAVVVQALRSQAALEQRRLEEGARSRRYLDVDLATNRVDTDGRLVHRH